MSPHTKTTSLHNVLRMPSQQPCLRNTGVKKCESKKSKCRGGVGGGSRGLSDLGGALEIVHSFVHRTHVLSHFFKFSVEI